MARAKLHLYFFHLKIVKMKFFFTILALKQPNSEKCIFAVYKYSRRLLKRTLLPKFLSSNLLLWLFYEELNSLSNLNLLESQNVQLVSKSNSSVSKLFIFIRILWVLNLDPNLHQYQIHNAYLTPWYNLDLEPFGRCNSNLEPFGQYFKSPWLIK